jgi:transcriptional regulator with XRE-family HTH domain
MQYFARWLHEARTRSGLTQEELGESCGVTGSYISRLEHERDHTSSGAPCVPPAQLVDRMAEALGVSPAEARLAAGYAPHGVEPAATAPHDPLWARLLPKFKRLPPEVQEVVVAEVEALYKKYARRK